MRRAAAVIAGAAATAGGAGVARAGWDDYKGIASLEYEAAYLHTYDREDADADADPERAVDGLGLAGVRLRGQVGKNWLGYRAGLDLRAGATAPGGFAYDCDLYAVGIAARLGRWSLFGITGGIGASGATGTVDDAVTFPVEAALDVALGGRVRVLARARLAWLAAAPNREDGARTIDFADELDASFAIRIGHRWTDWGFPTGNGYYLGVSYRESEGARMVGVVLGHSLDAGTRLEDEE